MYRLICISGQSSARTVILKEGDNLLGRAESNDIRISSNGVSKKHASITIKADSIHVTDLGSRNGTFVNGIMVKRKDLNPGDKIAIHDHVFQLVKGDVKVSELPGTSGIDFKKIHDEDDDDYELTPRMYSPGLKGQVDQFLDTTIMPFFEAIMKKNSMSFIIAVVMMVSVIVMTLVVTVPVVQFDRYILDQETAQRAVYIGNILAQQNRSAFTEGSREEVSVEMVEDQPGVTNAWVSDSAGRVLSSSRGAGNQLPGIIMGRVSRIISGELQPYRAGADVMPIGDSRYIVTSPIMVYSEEHGRQVIGGFAAIEFSTQAIKHSAAGSWQRILIGMAISCFIGLMLVLFFSKLFSLPFVRIYDEVDLALKGEAKRVTLTFGTKPVADLVELVNILLRRARKSSAKSMVGIDSLQDSQGVDYSSVFESVGKSLKIPFFVLDGSNAIVSANSAFANISSYRIGDWQGVAVVDAIREQKLLGVLLNLVSRFDSMGQDLSEEVLVNDKIHRISISGIKNDRGEFSYHCVSVEVV